MNGFRRKGYKMKAKDLLFRLKSNLFYKFYNQLCKNGVENSFITYLWSKVDVYVML